MEKANKAKLRSGDRCIMGEWSYDVEIEHIRRYEFAIPFVSGKSVLDAGCGTGYGTHILAENGAGKVDGVDIAEEAISYARKKASHPKVRYQVGDLYDPAVYGSPDVIISFEALEHVKFPEKLVAHAAASLKEKHGTYIVSTPNRLARNPDSTIHDPVQSDVHELEFSMDEFTTLLSKYFTDVTLYGQRILSPGRHEELRPYLSMIQQESFVVRAMKGFPLLFGLLKKVKRRLSNKPSPLFADISTEVAPIPEGHIPMQMIAVCRL